MKEFKKKLAVILAFCMVLTSTVPAFAATIQGETETEISAQTEYNALLENDEYEEASHSNAKYEDNILTDEEDIEEVIIEENSEDVALIDDTEGVLPAEDGEAEFFAEVKVGNVIITAKAEAGVVPKGTILKAKKVVDKEVKEAIDEVVEEKREDEAQVVESLKFDIKLIKDDEEIEPNGLVSLSFALADAAANADVNVYHIIEDEETKELVEAEVLEVETVEEPEDEATLVLETETPSFSYYVVEFTVGELQYVLEGDSSVKLSEILAELKIEGTVTEAVSGAPELFSVEKDAAGDDWTVTALKAFSTEEWMKVTVDGKEYKIIVTDTRTVASILPTGFPTDSNSNWKNTDGKDYRIYVSNSRLYLYVGAGGPVEVLEKTVEESNVEPLGSNYQYKASVGTIVLFKMSNGKLARIEISGTGLTDYNGTYEPPTYTVKFLRDGDVYEEQTVKEGEKATKPADPPKPGYDFAGWYTDVSCADDTEYNFYSPVTNDITLYAKWVVKSTITITSSRTEYELGETVKLEIVTTGIQEGTEFTLTDGTHTTMNTIGSDGKSVIYATNAIPGTYTYTASIQQYGIRDSIEITVKKGVDPKPDPKKKESSSGANSIYTGTSSYPVSDGKWTQNADGTWSYVAGRRFTSTWGYIANPAEGGKANWYYFDSYGRMLTGWHKLYWNGAYRWYYFSQTKDSNEGKCQLGGITPDGYRVGADGAWIED